MIREKRRWTKEEMGYFLGLINPYLFTMIHWKDDLTIPDDRTDLPKQRRGKQVITREQRLMMLDAAKQQQFCTGRKIFKTGVIESRYFHKPLLNLLTNQEKEGMFFTPRENHILPTLARIRIRAEKTPLFRLIRGRFNDGEGRYEFRTGFTWYNRIEGNPAQAGQNMVGLRCVEMMGDEGAYGNDAAYAERLNTALPNANILWAGVPNGIRGTKFHMISETQEGKGWSRHRYDFRANIIYHSLAAYKQLVADHGGAMTQSFLTQVLGQWGEATVASFPILPQVVDGPYVKRDLTGEHIANAITELGVLLNMKMPAGWEAFIIGGDLGYSPSPTILTVFFLRDTAWFEMGTVEMILANSIYQAHVVDTLAMRVLPARPARICLDAHGRGAGVLDALQNSTVFDNAYYRENLIDAGFAGSIPDQRIQVHKPCNQRVREGRDGYWYCDQCRLVVTSPDQMRAALIPAKQYLTIDLKEAFLNGQDYLEMKRKAVA